MSEERLCLVCGNVLIRRAKEKPGTFRDRILCSKTCAARRATNAQIERARYRTSPPRLCVVCGIEIPNKNPTLHQEYGRKKVCSRECKNKWQSTVTYKHIPPRPCEVCGGPITRGPDQDAWYAQKRKACSPECVKLLIASRAVMDLGEKSCLSCGVFYSRRLGESTYEFRVRKTCGEESCRVQCRALTIAKKQERNRKYPLDFSIPLKREIRLRDNHQCRICGQSDGWRDLAVHHIDYDKQNCREINLISLCAPCHLKTNHNRPHWTAFFQSLMEHESS